MTAEQLTQHQVEVQTRQCALNAALEVVRGRANTSMADVVGMAETAYAFLRGDVR